MLFPAAFVRNDGSNSEIDVEARTAKAFDLARELLGDRAKVPTKKDSHTTYCAEASQRTSYFYNQRSGKLVGNYSNFVYAQPVKDWCLTTFEFILDTYAILI